jgi:hypothetical protein
VGLVLMMIWVTEWAFNFNMAEIHHDIIRILWGCVPGYCDFRSSWIMQARVYCQLRNWFVFSSSNRRKYLVDFDLLLVYIW